MKTLKTIGLMIIFMFFLTLEVNAKETNVETINTEEVNIEKIKESEIKENSSGEFEYIMYFPENFDDTKYYPLILYLHGLGESGNNLSLLYKDDIYHPTLMSGLYNNKCDVNAIVIAPQLNSGSWKAISGNNGKIIQFCNNILDTYDFIDKNNISVTGPSLGAMGLMPLIINNSGYFKAAAPVAGGYCLNLNLDLIIDMPLFIIHGAEDYTKSNNVQYSYELYEYLKSKNSKNLEYSWMDNYSHSNGIGRDAYTNTNVLNWLISFGENPFDGVYPQKYHLNYLYGF